MSGPAQSLQSGDWARFLRAWLAGRPLGHRSGCTVRTDAGAPDDRRDRTRNRPGYRTRPWNGRLHAGVAVPNGCNRKPPAHRAFASLHPASAREISGSGHHLRPRAKVGRPCQSAASGRSRRNRLGPTVSWPQLVHRLTLNILLSFAPFEREVSPTRITLENNGKIRPQLDRENAFAGASGGGDGPETQPSPACAACRFTTRRQSFIYKSIH